MSDPNQQKYDNIVTLELILQTVDSMSSPTEGEPQDISARASTRVSSTGPSTKGAVTPKARSSTMVPALPLTKEEAVVRVEAVVVGRKAKQARRDRLRKEEASTGESTNSMVQGEVNNNVVPPEGRHRLPPLVIRGPRVEVARRLSGASRGLARWPRKGRSQQIRNVARSVAEEAVQGELGEGHGSSNGPQIKVEEEPSTSQLAIIPEHRYEGQELEVNPASHLELTVKSTIGKNLVFIKGSPPPRPRWARCEELPAAWRTKALRALAELILQGMTDEQLRRVAGAHLSLKLGKDLPMALNFQLLPGGREMLKMEAIAAIHRTRPAYLEERVWRLPFRASVKMAQVLSWEGEEEQRLNLYEEARVTLESATLLFIASLVARCSSGEGEDIDLGGVEEALLQYPTILAGMAMTGAPACVRPSMLWPTAVLESGCPDVPISGPEAITIPDLIDPLGTSSGDSSMVLSDDDEGLGEVGVDQLQGIKEEVAEHAVLQAMYGQPPAVHLPNPFYQGSSDGESEQGQVQAEELTEEGVVVVTLSDSEGE